MSWPGLFTDVNQAEVGYQPLYLVAITCVDGTVLRISTHDVTWSGNAYEGRLAQESLGTLQYLSEQGLDVMPNVTFQLANADQEMAVFDRAHPIFGARLQITFVFNDLGTSDFSTDPFKVWVGRCGKPEYDDLTFTVQASALNNLALKVLPTFPIQPTCPKVQPQNSAQFAAALNEDSIYYPCGLTALQYTGPCHQTPEGCKANNNYPRNAAIQWNPPNIGITREYTSGNTFTATSDPNVAKYGERVPMVLGTAWVDAVVTNVIPDGNSTRGEAIVCDGLNVGVNNILKVVLNDEDLPAATDVNGNALHVQDPLFRYNVINKGIREGTPTGDAGFNGLGDPYGSMCAIEWCVPRKVDSGNVPNIKVLVQGPPVRIYSNSTTFITQWTDNPAWHIFSLLRKVGIAISDIDIDSFIAASNYFGEPITYTDQYGNTSATHARYAVSMVIRQRRSAADILQGILRGSNGNLVWSGALGKIQLQYRGTLADSQPSLPDGSNHGAAVSSVTADGTPANGYVAWHVDRVLRDENGKAMIRRLSRSITDTPNKISFGFSNAERVYSADSIAIVDPDAVDVAGQEIETSIKVDGVGSLDQAQRIARSFLDEQQADQWEFTFSFAMAKVRPGHLISSDISKYGFAGLFRVLKISPASNGETITFQVIQHNDSWYLDSNGQDGDRRRRNPARNRLARPSYPWAPHEVAPVSGDPIFAPGDYNFALLPTFESLTNGDRKQGLDITGRLPVNIVSPDIYPPIVGLQGSVTTGGSLVAGGITYYFQVVAVDVAGNISAPSETCAITILGVGTRTAIIPIASWDPNTTDWRVYGSTSPVNLTLEAMGSGTPSTISITNYIENAEGVPDLEFWGLIARVRRVHHAGVAGQIVSAVGSGTITLPGAGLGGYDWTGCDIMLAAKGDFSALPIFDCRVTSNAGDVLSVAPNPSGIVAIGDVMIMLSAPALSGRRLTDTRWLNPLSNGGLGLAPGAEVGRLHRWWAGTGRSESYRIVNNGTDWIDLAETPRTTPDSTSRGIVEDASWFSDTAETLDINNSDPTAEITLPLRLENDRNIMVRVAVATFDGDGNEPPEYQNPERMCWLLGSGLNTRTVTSNDSVTPDDQVIYADSSAGGFVLTFPPMSTVKHEIIVKKTSSDSNTITVAAFSGEDFDGDASVNLTDANDFLRVVPHV